MQSVNQQLDLNHDAREAAATEAARPEPFIPEHLSRRYADLFTVNGTPRRDAGARTVLAAAFERLGRGVPPATAAQQSRAFYRSSGQPWTLGLSGPQA